MDKRKIRSEASFSLEERDAIVREYLSGNYSKSEIWFKYTGDKIERGRLNRWIRKLGYLNHEKAKPRIRYSTYRPSICSALDNKEPEKTPEELQRKIKELEKQLERAQLKAEGYEIMIDIAENELNIPIRKKRGTK